MSRTFRADGTIDSPRYAVRAVAERVGVPTATLRVGISATGSAHPTMIGAGTAVQSMHMSCNGLRPGRRRT